MPLVYLFNISCLKTGWELWNTVTCQDWTSKRITKCWAQHVPHLDKVRLCNNLWISQEPVCKVQRGRELCVRLLLNDSRLRVRGEGSKQNLRHVLLAKGHQEQRQALIGWIHAATLKTDEEVGRNVSAAKTTQRHVTEVEMFKEKSATPLTGGDWLSQVQHR